MPTMDFELDIVDSLIALGYKDLNLEKINAALDNGIESVELRKLIYDLANKLHYLRKTDEHISSCKKDHDEFTFELSLLLTELGCPYRQFLAVPLSERFQKRETLLQLLDYLICELMSSKMCLKVQTSCEPPNKKSKTQSHIQGVVEQLITDLQIEQPKNEKNSKMLFERLFSKLEHHLKRLSNVVIGEPLMPTSSPLSDDQWRNLDDMYKDLEAEYNLRRQMMITRLEATIQSFQWSDTMKHRQSEIAERFQKKFVELEVFKFGGLDTNIAALLAARTDLAIIEKTSSVNVRKNTTSKIEKHVIGTVPDRGGRTNEYAPPPPEMPSWQQQRAGGARGGGRGNFHGRPGATTPFVEYQAPPQHQRNNDKNQSWINNSGRVQGSGWNPQVANGGRGYAGSHGNNGGSRRGGRGRGYGGQVTHGDYRHGGQ